VSSWAGELSGGSGGGGLRAWQDCNGHRCLQQAHTEPQTASPTSSVAFVAIVLRPGISDPSHVSDARRYLKPVSSTGLI